MKVGICGDILRTYEGAAATGADYFETGFSRVATLGNEEYLQLCDVVNKKGFPILSANGFLPGEMILVGEKAVSNDALSEYLEKAFERNTAIGVKTVVWGSGATRIIPEGFDKDKAHEQLLNAGKLFGDTAEKYGVKIAIEPLNSKETNVFNTVKSAYEFAKELGHPAINVLADSFHMLAEKESFDTLKDYKDLLIHAHIAEGEWGNYDHRLIPDIKDEFDIKKFIFALKSFDYKGNVSIEASNRPGDWYENVKIGVEAIKTWLN